MDQLNSMLVLQTVSLWYNLLLYFLVLTFSMKEKSRNTLSKNKQYPTLSEVTSFSQHVARGMENTTYCPGRIWRTLLCLTLPDSMRYKNLGLPGWYLKCSAESPDLTSRVQGVFKTACASSSACPAKLDTLYQVITRIKTKAYKISELTKAA